MEAVNVTDMNTKYVELDKGTWLVDGEIYNNNSYNSKLKVVVKDFENIRRVSETTYISHYLSGGEKMSVVDFNERSLKLLSKRRLVDEDTYQWDSLEDEFEYRKFIQSWTKITKIEQVLSDPIKVEVIKERQVETGNQYINSEFANGKDSDMFVYNQTGAYHGIVRDTFTKLNMDFVEKVDYYNTRGKKIWGNSTHSLIQYVTAFGKYIFNDSYGKAQNVRGTLDQCIARYEIDKQKISEIIINGYNEHFGGIDENSFDFSTLITSLRNASNYLKISDYKKAGENNYRSVNKNLNNAIKQIQEAYKTI